MKSRPTQARLKELFDYDPNTGTVTRKVATTNAVKVGDQLKRKDSNGYIQVSVDSRLYTLHRLIWVWVHGKYPDGQIDHINRIRDDNRLCNLREVTLAQNMLNKSVYTNNWTGTPGVYWHARSCKWIACISVKSRRIHLGYFSSMEVAKETYLKAKKAYHAL
jgi:hypothetical protein